MIMHNLLHSDRFEDYLLVLKKSISVRINPILVKFRYCSLLSECIFITINVPIIITYYLLLVLLLFFPLNYSL